MHPRRDFRTKHKFAKDIKECTLIENKLMSKYVDWLNTNSKIPTPYYFEDHGIDNSGAYISDNKKVDTRADFLLKNLGRPSRKIEIKFCRKDMDVFHLKVSQIRKYIEADVCIVNFMGIDGPNPRFCILTPKMLKEALETGEKVFFKAWGKDCIRFTNDTLKWNKINEI